MKWLRVCQTLTFLIVFGSLVAQQQDQILYQPFPNQILKLSWQKQGMPYSEYMGDAVVLKPPVASKVLIEPAEWEPGSIIQQAGKGLVVQTNDLLLNILEPFDSGHVRGWRIRMPEGKPWYGGGEKSLPLDRRGQRISLYNGPSYGYELYADRLNYAVPFVLCAAGYGLLFDNPAKGYMDFGAAHPGVLEVGFEAGEVNMYLVPGKNADEILRSYTHLTGRQPLPPRWVLGNFMSRFGYLSQQQVEQTAADMRKAGIPADAIIVDVFWFGNTIQHTLGNLEFVDASKWPDPDAMIRRLKQQQIKTVLVTEPYILKDTRQFDAAQPFLAKDSGGRPFMLQDFYFGYGGLLDLFRPEVRDWFFSFYKKLTDRGVAGWWGDLGEPERHPEGVMHDLSSRGITRPVPANHIHNLYGHMWSKMLYENWQKTYPGKRLFYLNRAGFAGSQRYSIFPWTGDVSRSWGGLKAQLYNLQSMSLSGVPYVHSDAGGFSMVSKDDPELYTRWLQMATFTPILRPHGTDLGKAMQPEGTLGVPSEPVYKPEPHRTIARRWIEQRYRLLPYHYQLAYEASTKGRPFIRPMFYYDPADAGSLSTMQYYYGDAFLIAPVTDAGAMKATVWFPKGKWYRYSRPSQVIEGRQDTLSVAAPLGDMPVFVKGGSIVPVWEKKAGENTTAYNMQTPLLLQYFPMEGKHQASFYDDDGEAADALTNEAIQQVWRLEADQNGGSIKLKADLIRGAKRPITWAIPLGPAGMVLAGNAKSIGTIIADGKTIKGTIKVVEGMRWMYVAGKDVLLKIR